jgi:integrase/recombinase XerD
VTGHRNRAIVVVLWRAGLRAAELVSLRPKDVDLETGEVRILRGKGRKARTVALDPEATAVVERWAAQRKLLIRQRKVRRRSTLFCTLTGTELQTSYLRQLLPRLAKRAGIEKRVHPHSLRHTCMMELAKEGVPMPIIQAVLGHTNVATTNHYVNHFGSPEVIAAMQARLW